MPKPSSLKIGLSGVRGVVGESFTPQLVTSFAAAFGTFCGPGPVVIGTDTRPSRLMVTHAALAGLLSVGCTPVDLGIVPLPALQFYIRREGAAGGICITASHNPMEWNALKFFGADGVTLRANEFSQLRDLYHQGVYPRVHSLEIPQPVADDRAIALHGDGVRNSVDFESIRSRRYKVVVDCCNGAAFLASPVFLRSLGCEVIELNTSSNQPFPRDPEPLAENIVQLCRVVIEEGADIGFAQDADADRLAVVDEKGVPLGEDATLALAVDHVLQRFPTPVAVSMSTSRMIDDLAQRHGTSVSRTKVGEIHVLERLVELSGKIGGEGNGGVVVPEVNACRDSFVAMALILEGLARRGVTVSAWKESLPVYSIVKEKLACRARDVNLLLRLLRNMYGAEEIDLTDGVRIVWPDSWIHVRGSGTEPVIRIIAEAKTEDAARSLVMSVRDYLRPFAV